MTRFYFPTDCIDEARPERQQFSKGLLGGGKINTKRTLLDKTNIAGQMVIGKILLQYCFEKPSRDGGEEMKKSLVIKLPQRLHHRQAARSMAKAMG